LKWGIGENAADAKADGRPSLSWFEDASIVRVDDEVDTASVSEELPESGAMADGEISDSRAVGSFSFVNRPIAGR